MGWRSSPLLANVLVGALVVLASYSVTACRMGHPAVDHFAVYDLEVVNRAPESVRIRVFLGGQSSKDLATGEISSYGSGVLSMRAGEKRMFEMSLLGPEDSPEDNGLVRSFRRISFFEENSDAPYKSYDYPLAECSDVPASSDCGDDMWISYARPDGPGERLFVESQDRPFYLERDSEDLDLGRIVITFVPDAAAGFVGA